MLYVELLQVSVEVQYTIKEKLLTHIWHRITEKFPSVKQISSNRFVPSEEMQAGMVYRDHNAITIFACAKMNNKGLVVFTIFRLP